MNTGSKRTRVSSEAGEVDLGIIRVKVETEPMKSDNVAEW